MLKLFLQKLTGARKSLTILFNLIAGLALATIQYLQYNLPLVQENLPQLQAYIDPHIFTKIAMYVAIINILLRFKTKAALQDK